MFGLSPAALVAGLVVGFYRADYRVDAWVLGVLICVGALVTGISALRQRPSRVFSVFLLTFVLAALQVHLHVLPTRDSRRHDRQFLMTLHEHLPPQPMLFATGGAELVRHIFYVQIPLTGVWNPKDIGKHLEEADVFFVVGRMRHSEPLKCFGKVTVMLQSMHTRHEKSIQDRYTLFRIQRVKSFDTHSEGKTK